MNLFLLLSAVCTLPSKLSGSQESNSAENSKLIDLRAVCYRDRMRVYLEFDTPFHGIVFSEGNYGHPECTYVAPLSGVTHANFDVFYRACGTRRNPVAKYYENTIVVQYGADVIQERDEAKRVRCRWSDDYRRPASRPALKIAEAEAIPMEFSGDQVDCWMEIQKGRGPWAPPVSGIVPVGSPLTLVVAVADREHFDLRVRSCRAHDGRKPPILLTDDDGCVLRPKMLTPFLKVRDYAGRASVLSYSYFYAFKFPDSVDVHVRCNVQICRHVCPESCSRDSGAGFPGPSVTPDHRQKSAYSKIVTVLNENRIEPDPLPDRSTSWDHRAQEIPETSSPSEKGEVLHEDSPRPVYVHRKKPEEAADESPRPSWEVPAPRSRETPSSLHPTEDPEPPTGPFLLPDHAEDADDPVYISAPDLSYLYSLLRSKKEGAWGDFRRHRYPYPVPQFVHGHPRYGTTGIREEGGAEPPGSPQSPRRRRRADQLGVGRTYRVISSADLDFESDPEEEGKAWREDPIPHRVSGVCLSATGFSACFGSLAALVVGSATACLFLRLRLEAARRAPSPGKPR
ncbi:uncharacterized protein LOC111628701 [Centruroides sculpturatus]|uniref:uncharacterized protein LOC111628701 n=1 Tax=Centruroides sculpturatus TaxID=218467 RepID=UPI000C6E6116|nr:uncharacterized protein LOC111628701 [Centruroides sculpturatus]